MRSKWPLYTFFFCNLHGSSRMVRKGDYKREAVGVPKLKPVKHLRGAAKPSMEATVA